MLPNVEVKQAGKPSEWVGTAEYIQVQIGNITYTISVDPETGASGFAMPARRSRCSARSTSMCAEGCVPITGLVED